MKIIIYVVVLTALTSCNQFKSNNATVDKATNDSILRESNQIDNDTLEPFQT